VVLGRISVGVHCTDQQGLQIVLILLNKPYQVLSQFTDKDGRATLGNFVEVADVYPAGRLDYDSEGLILLTDDGRLQARISQPTSKITKTYWSQVEGTPSERQLSELVSGVKLKDGMAQAVSATLLDPPARLWERNPPIRYRANVADRWIEIALTQGRNRQVRRMTAAVGLPTLRLIRYSIGPWSIEGLKPGQSRQLSSDEAWQAL
jgi:23S rRNA pseudouridine2457 synthase